jgi:hypothetical protein
VFELMTGCFWSSGYAWLMCWVKANVLTVTMVLVLGNMVSQVKVVLVLCMLATTGCVHLRHHLVVPDVSDPMVELLLVLVMGLLDWTTK